nr:hypothetical protein [Tanacetum cinerariifolium]GEV56628.1 hypothetical protein [Tanacetum cinerariifolium]
VDKKKVIITETSVRSDLHLEDAKGTDCPPTATIFKQLTLMGYENLTQKLTFYKALQCLSAKTTAWNEFSSTMAFAIICLDTNQKFNFSKYNFDHMVRNLEDEVKFLMFPRFVPVFMDRKDFSGKVTPLFETMMVQPQEDIGEDLKIPTDSHYPPNVTQPSTFSQPQQKHNSKKSKRRITEVPQLSDSTHDVADEHVTTTSVDPLLSGKDRLKLTNLIELCTQLQSRFLALETTKSNQALEIGSLKRRVKKLEKKTSKKTLFLSILTQKHRKPNRKNTKVQPSSSTKHVTNKVVHKERGDRLVRATTTASSLEAEQDSGNIGKTQSKATPNEASCPGTTSGGGPRVLAIEKTKTTQALDITSLKRRVKKLEKKQRSRTHKLKILYKERIEAIDADEDITLVSAQDDVEMFDVDDLLGEEVFVDKDDVDKEVNDEVQKVVDEVVEDIDTTKLIVDASQVNAAGELNVVSIAITDSVAATITIDEVTLAKALTELKALKPKVKGVVIQEPKEPVTLKKKEQIRLNKEAALKLQAKLQAEFKEEQRLAREKAQEELEANIALIKTRDDVQAKIDVDYQLAEILQAEEQQELTDEEKAKLFMQHLEKRRKFFAAKKAEEKRNKPPTQAQQRKIMCTYLKNIEGKKLKDLRTSLLTLTRRCLTKLSIGKEISPYSTYTYKYAEEEASGRIVGIKSDLNAGENTVAHIEKLVLLYKEVTAAQVEVSVS